MLLDVIDVKPLSNYRILVTFENNEKRIFDVKPLFERARWQVLKDERLFKLVRVQDGTVQWSIHSGVLDICPSWLFSDSVPYTEEDAEILTVKTYSFGRVYIHAQNVLNRAVYIHAQNVLIWAKFYFSQSKRTVKGNAKKCHSQNILSWAMRKKML